MSQQNTVSQQSQNRVVEPSVSEPLPEVAPLDRTLESIKADSLDDPETYLEETEVPKGGE